MGLTTAEKDAICPRTYHAPHGAAGSFHYLRHNINQKSVTYGCTRRRGCDCRCVLSFRRDKRTGVVDFGSLYVQGTHTRRCFVATNPQGNEDEYPWEGKSKPAAKQSPSAIDPLMALATIAGGKENLHSGTPRSNKRRNADSSSHASRATRQKISVSRVKSEEASAPAMDRSLDKTKTKTVVTRVNPSLSPSRASHSRTTSAAKVAPSSSIDTHRTGSIRLHVVVSTRALYLPLDVEDSLTIRNLKNKIAGRLLAAGIYNVDLGGHSLNHKDHELKHDYLTLKNYQIETEAAILLLPRPAGIVLREIACKTSSIVARLEELTRELTQAARPLKIQMSVQDLIQKSSVQEFTEQNS